MMTKNTAGCTANGSSETGASRCEFAAFPLLGLDTRCST